MVSQIQRSNNIPNNAPVLTVEDVNFWYGEKQALFDVNLEVFPREIIAFMGPSGCGKSTLLKMFNRMHDQIPDAQMTGSVLFDGGDINDPGLDPVLLRRRFGWVAQAPNPFPKSVWENVAYGPRLHGLCDTEAELDAHIRDCLARADLLEELEGRLHEPGTQLSGGQQQRLCIARALSIKPDVLLMDEPCSAIDPIATAHVEKLILEMKKDIAIVIITHNLEQAGRLADRVAFFHMGRLVEVGPTEAMFNHPAEDETARYLSGTFG
ncbi:phosphate ABC transporter ATP-binding protein [Rhodobacteraceae bacterium NNCM2]|nr:phosphate ABC transporter ATP-binding protein [Coraliihabitans acroporae]